MIFNKNFKTPNFDPVQISIEFVILHYTACSLKRTLEIFQSESTRASAHLVIDFDGTVYEIVKCSEGVSQCAWHAGTNSCYIDNDRKNWEKFNQFSIGIELVNFNGNIFEYTELQYKSLELVMKKLIHLYPSLSNPERILGHEHVAGFRGKSDPGHQFDWERFFNSVYGEASKPTRQPRLNIQAVSALKNLAKYASADRDQFFMLLSQLTESLKLN